MVWSPSSPDAPSIRDTLNGKVERFNRTLLEEWAYARLYHSNAEGCGSFSGTG
jgi:hypothetical protein